MAESIKSLQEADGVLQELRASVELIGAAITSPTLKTEDEYVQSVNPMIDAATVKYQVLASYLQSHAKKHDKQYKAVQRGFVKVMQDLQQVQRSGAKRREVLCEAAFMTGDQAVDSVDLQRAKEEVLEAGQIAAEAMLIKDMFQQVGSIIHEQGKDIEQIEHKVENIRITIGKGVTELEQAQRLQAEARKKQMLMLCVGLLIVAVIVIPIVLTLTSS